MRVTATSDLFLQIRTVQKKQNVRHVVSCSAATFKKKKKNQVKLIFATFYITSYIQNIIVTCNQYK